MGKKELTMAGSMSLKTVVRTSSIQKCIFRWFISRYELLKSERLYYQVFTNNGFNYTYKLIKTRSKLYIAFQCKHSNGNGKFYLTNGCRIDEAVEAIEISEGQYVGDFPESLLLHEGNAYKTIGLMNIAFRFITDCSTSVQTNKMGEVGQQSDFDKLCHDIQSGFIESRHSDFFFKFDSVSIKAHKSLLYARSNFFEEFFTKNEDAVEFAVLGITPGIINEVLLYIYGGELCDIEVESMVKVLEAAYLLRIPSLKKRCLDYFEENNLWQAIENIQFFEYKIEDFEN